MITPTQRTLQWLRKAGYIAGIVEKWNHIVRRRVDLFGWCDLVCAHPSQQGTTYVQTTSGSNHASRRDKILASPEAKILAATGNSLLIISWSKRGERGKVKRWEPRIEKIEIGMFAELPDPQPSVKHRRGHPRRGLDPAAVGEPKGCTARAAQIEEGAA